MKLYKRVISGRFKGVKIELPSKSTTRSSKTIVLESYFNTLQFEIVESTFIELFAGSGSVGIEALSRGASKILFFEQDREALKRLRSNINLVEPNSCTVIAGDTFENFPRSICAIGGRSYFYIDPPFSIRENQDQIYAKMVKLIESIPSELVELITVEHMSALDLPDSIATFKLIKSKRFGKTTLSYYR